MYAGLRRGELTALRWEDVDLAQGVIHVKRGWDHIEGEIAPKSREGRCKVPVPAPLRDVLLEHRMSADDSAVRVFRSQSWIAGAHKRARKAWNAAKLAPITLHEGRHTYASLMIAAGVDVEGAVEVFMGHANISDHARPVRASACPAPKTKRPDCSTRSLQPADSAGLQRRRDCRAPRGIPPIERPGLGWTASERPERVRPRPDSRRIDPSANLGAPRASERAGGYVRGGRAPLAPAPASPGVCSRRVRRTSSTRSTPAEVRFREGQARPRRADPVRPRAGRPAGPPPGSADRASLDEGRRPARTRVTGPRWRGTAR